MLLFDGHCSLQPPEQRAALKSSFLLLIPNNLSLKSHSQF